MDFDWESIASSFLGTAPSIISSVVGGQRVAQANTRAAQLSENSNAAALNELRNTREQAVNLGAPGVQYLRNVVSRDPSMLTPAQTQAISDSQREFNRGPALKSYGGRAYSRMFADMSGRMRAGAVQQNQQRSDSAAGNLSGITRQGLSMSPAIAQVQSRAGDAAGNAMTANASTEADTMGQIASVFANSVKDQNRESRYAGYKSSFGG